jgi:hypothetical protein
MFVLGLSSGFRFIEFRITLRVCYLRTIDLSSRTELANSKPRSLSVSFCSFLSFSKVCGDFTAAGFEANEVWDLGDDELAVLTSVYLLKYDGF